MSYLDTRYAQVYQPDATFYRFKARRLLDFIRRFDSRPVQSIIDLGCGCGDLAAGVHEVGQLSVAGIERDAAMVDIANSKKVGKFFSQDLLHASAELQGQFDVVCSFEVFEHLTHSEHRVAFSLYKAYARTHGIGVIMVPNSANPFLGNWLSWADYTHRSCFTPESLSQMLRENGVKDARIYPWYSAGSRFLLTAREVTGSVLGSFFKKLVGVLSTFPGSNDPFFKDALPLSSHLIAVFRIPRDEA